MGSGEAQDELVELAGEVVDRMDVDIVAAPGRCRNSCASAPPYVVGADGHARVVVVGTARGRCWLSWASQSEEV